MLYRVTRKYHLTRNAQLNIRWLDASYSHEDPENLRVPRSADIRTRKVLHGSSTGKKRKLRMQVSTAKQDSEKSMNPDSYILGLSNSGR
ncbi:unnamed protein product [Lasius platythorax]|uniref:Uncharacterized protein n=1 Tax=Lasius platythorax TaxID=488582 RepID=A0AAV2NG04_9HYME